MDMVKEVAGHVNSAHAQVDNVMFSYCFRFGEDFEVLMEPWRKFVEEVKLRAIAPKKNEKVLLILLSDYVVFASGKKKPKWKGKVSLIDCWVADLPEEEDQQNLFALYCPASSTKYVFSAASPEEKNKWVGLLVDHIAKTLADSHTPSGQRASHFDKSQLAIKKDSNAFFKNPEKPLLSGEEFQMLQAIVIVPDVISESDKKRETQTAKKRETQTTKNRDTQASK